MGKANLPERHGGAARATTSAWVAQRLAAFPRMGLPDEPEAEPEQESRGRV